MPRSEQLAASLSGTPSASLGTKAARGVVWTTLQSLVARLSGLVVFLILARLLQPADFGLLAAAQVFIALSRTLAEAGLTRTLVQRPQLRAAHLDSALLVAGGFGVLLSVLLVTTAPLVARLYDLPHLTPVLIALAIVPTLTGLSSVPESVLRRQLRFRSVAMRGMVSVVLSGVLGITLALLGAGVWALVAQVVSQVFIALIVLWWSLRWIPGRAWERSAVMELMGFGADVVGISVLSFVNRRAGELIIGVVLGPVALGLFSVGMKILTLSLDILVSNVQKVALPVFSRVADTSSRLSSAYLRATGFTTLLAFPGFALLGLFGNQLTPIIFGEQWVSAGPLMSILAFIGPVQSIAVFNNSIMLATGDSRLALRWTAVTAVVNTVGFAASASFGIRAVAAVYVGLNWLLLPVGLYLVRRVSAVTLRDQLRTLSVPLAGCLAMVAVVGCLELFTDLDPLTLLLVGGPLSLAAYLAVALPFRLALLKAALAQVLSRRAKPEPA